MRTRTVILFLVALLTVPAGSAALGSGATASAAVPAQMAGAPEVRVQTPAIDWGAADGTNVPYAWSTRIENPNDRAVVVKVRLELLDAQGTVVHEDLVAGQVGPQSDLTLRQNGSVHSQSLDAVEEARGVPTAQWADEPYKFRTVAAFVDGLQRLEVFFVLEDWRGRPVTASGSLEMFIVERQRLRADFAGGGMRRPMKTLYARRFEIDGRDYARRRIGFISNDYSPPAVTLGPIHYTVFDHEPRGDDGLVRFVFRTESGVEIIGEDRVFF